MSCTVLQLDVDESWWKLGVVVRSLTAVDCPKVIAKPFAARKRQAGPKVAEWARCTRQSGRVRATKPLQV